METKLTLSMEKRIIEEAKEYARKKNTSLSGLIRNYLVRITRADDKENLDITPLVKSLSGVLSLKAEEDHKKDYTSYLEKKYQ